MLAVTQVGSIRVRSNVPPVLLQAGRVGFEQGLVGCGNQGASAQVGQPG